jgi:hypothetical protein
MNYTDIIIELRKKLDIPVGRHLYGVLGTYKKLDIFSQELQRASLSDGNTFPAPLSVNEGIINAFSDEEFREIVKNEARRPEPTRMSVRNAFEAFLRENFAKSELLILEDLELIFAYDIDLSPLRTMATDERRIVLLLPGKRSGERLVMYPAVDGEYKLPRSLITDDHLWEVK